MAFHHIPVLLPEVLEALRPKAGGVYLDGTLGGGGHSGAILRACGGAATLYGIDRDENAIAAAGARLAEFPGFHAIHGNFHDAAALLAEVGGEIAGTAGINSLGAAEKTRHRASFGISITRAWWGLGIGRALTEACIECARKAGYLQMELEVVADNSRALALYKSAGFVEYGRNPKGFLSRNSGWQENVLMRLEL